MADGEHHSTVLGEVIKLIHGDLPAVRWTCNTCGEDSCSIFFEPEVTERQIECETCNSITLVRKANN
jgi:hypothetical protein